MDRDVGILEEWKECFLLQRMLGTFFWRRGKS
jgi:hypothetical protein